MWPYTEVEQSWLTAPASLRARSEILTRTLLQRLALWRLRARERAELASMNERDLHDLGLTPDQAVFEAAKPFWKE